MAAGSSIEWMDSEIFIPTRFCLKAKSLQAEGYANFQEWNFMHSS